MYAYIYSNLDRRTSWVIAVVGRGAVGLTATLFSIEVDPADGLGSLKNGRGITLTHAGLGV